MAFNEDIWVKIPAIINHANGSTYKEISKTVLDKIPISINPKLIRDKYTQTVKLIFIDKVF